MVELLQTKLPVELFNQIKESVLEMALCPGYVFPQRCTFTDQQVYEWNGKSHPVARPELLRLSKAIYAGYQSRYWGENVFVIGTGWQWPTLKWLGHHLYPRNICQRIRKVHITLTIKDMEEEFGDYFEVLPLEIYHQLPANLQGNNENSASTPFLDDPRPTASARCLHAACIWRKKLQRICQLPLTELMIDVTETYCPNGFWIHVPLVWGFLEALPKLSGLPIPRVIAPTEENEKTVRDYITVQWLKGL
ncbi:MAG: hypothetical protein Q9209_002373 [Squamulea sp. 1 TL-2023]